MRGRYRDPRRKRIRVRHGLAPAVGDVLSFRQMPAHFPVVAAQEANVIFRLELVTVPVSDVDRAKAFYVDQAGFSVEQDHQVDETHRFVELMPPGSPCSIALTTGYVDSEPGSLKGVQVNVDDADAAHAFLGDRGVEVSEIQGFPWGRFCFFSDPDGNTWSVHEPPPEA